MNQQLLTRLFKSIDGTKDSNLVKVAFSIISNERKKGHDKLAKKLEIILEDRISESQNHKLQLAKNKIYKMPVDRRYRLPLATHIEHESLRRHMILSNTIELKIERIEKEFLAKKRLASHNLKPRTKILFHGPSGCGKSMAAEKISWDLGLPFYKVRFDSIISSYLGESSTNLNQLFESIKDFPCVLLLDEFDIIAQNRKSNHPDVGEMRRIVNILLGLLEEYDGPGIIIATTNLEGTLDDALFRRFDDIIEMRRPSITNIERILRMSFSALNLSSSIDLKGLASKMKNLSYAIIVKVAKDAAKSAIVGTRKIVSQEDINRALKENRALNK